MRGYEGLSFVLFRYCVVHFLWNSSVGQRAGKQKEMSTEGGCRWTKKYVVVVEETLGKEDEKRQEAHAIGARFALSGWLQ